MSNAPDDDPKEETVGSEESEGCGEDENSLLSSQQNAQLERLMGVGILTREDLEKVLNTNRTDRMIKVVERAVEVKDETREQFAGEQPTGHTTSDDWVNRFLRYAEDVSDDAIREVFARVLAGEYVRPGTFSFQTLEKLRIIDTRVAKALAAVRPFLVNDSWLPCWGGLEELLSGVDIDELVSAGLAVEATAVPALQLKTDDDEYRGLYYTTDRVIEIKAEKRPRFTKVGPQLTRPGRELATLIPTEHHEQHFQLLLAALESYNEMKMLVGVKIAVAWTTRSDWESGSPTLASYSPARS